MVKIEEHQKDFPRAVHGSWEIETFVLDTLRCKRSIATPKRLPLPMKRKFQHLEEEDIIHPVKSPIDLCVIVQKMMIKLDGVSTLPN